MLRSDLPEDEQDEHPDLTSLTGYTLCDIERGEIGIITAIDTSTLNTLVQLDNGALLPLHEDFVAEVRAGEKKIIIRAPEGLLQ